jgi:lysophospholipase L1-like esterase
MALRHEFARLLPAGPPLNKRATAANFPPDAAGGPHDSPLEEASMLVRGKFMAVIGLLAVLAAAPAAEKDKTSASSGFFFKDGDRIVMMGDSITEQHLYSNYVEMWTVSRVPTWKLTFRNVGIGGDTSGGGNSRFKRDVLAHMATAMTVDFGMNDGGYQPFNEQRFGNYMKGLQGIADQARAAGVRVAWVTPQPVEHNPGNKAEFYNDTLEKFSAGVKDIAKKNNGLFVDQFHPYWAVVKKARDAGVNGRITGGDAVHPGPAGQVVMAASILKGLNFPRQVASVVIDASGDGKLVSASNCKVTGLKTEGGIRFEQQDAALPFFPAGAESILKTAPILEDMNHYNLTVTGLKEGRYEIRLGGKKVAEHSAADLAKGVSLAAAALATGPVSDQVNKVWKAVQDKNRYFHDMVHRGVNLNGKVQGDQRQALFEERMQKMPELDEAVRQALVMRPHQVEIVSAAR